MATMTPALSRATTGRASPTLPTARRPYSARTERPGRVATPPASAGSSDVRADPALESLILALTNEARSREAALAGLAPEPDLVPIARAHGEDMLRRGYFAHVSPDGITSAERIGRGHHRLIGTNGENIWMATGHVLADARTTAAEIVDDWLGSPGHRANILRETFTHLGVGVVRNGDVIMAVQNFAGARGYLARPLPERVDPGTWLDLTLAPYPPGTVGATRYSVADARSDEDSGEPLPLDEPFPRLAPGTYALWLWFPDGGSRYAIFPGPWLDVR